jgi:hypothetical protein
MTVQYSIEASTLFLHVEGHYRLADIREALNQAISAPEFTAPMLLFADASQSEGGSSAMELQTMASHLGLIKEHFLPDWLVVVSGPLRYGLTRMLAVFLEFHGIHLHVYRDVETAKQDVEQFRV